MEEGGGFGGSSSVRRQSQCLESVTKGKNSVWVLDNSQGLLLENTHQVTMSVFLNCTFSWLFSQWSPGFRVH